jgi:hypothetical protein
VIEGACRHLIGARLDITGARLVSNGDSPTYCALHLAQEHQRIHQTRYQHPLTRTV